MTHEQLIILQELRIHLVKVDQQNELSFGSEHLMHGVLTILDVLIDSETAQRAAAQARETDIPAAGYAAQEGAIENHGTQSTAIAGGPAKLDDPSHPWMIGQPAAAQVRGANKHKKI